MNNQECCNHNCNQGRDCPLRKIKQIKPTSNLKFVNKLINRADCHVKVKVLQQWWSTRDSQFDEEDIALDTNGEWRDVTLESEDK